jgi:hypothetical protein
VAKLRLGPSGVEKYGWFMGSPSRCGPAGQLRVQEAGQDGSRCDAPAAQP